MASGGIRKQFGAFTGTGAQLDIKTLDFRPKRVVLKNENRIMLEWQESMADASAFKTAAAGTRTLITSAGITPLANGFRLGTDSINGSGEVIHWEAED